MKLKNAWLAVLLTLPLPLLAQAPSVITMAEESHHHLALHNEYVNVYNAEAAPGDSLALHRHVHDGVAIAIGEQTVTIGIPGKPDVHAKIADGQVRLQATGYVHSTHNDSKSAYHTIAVELLQPQTGEHNAICVEPDARSERARASAPEHQYRQFGAIRITRRPRFGIHLAGIGQRTGRASAPWGMPVVRKKRPGSDVQEWKR